MILLTYLGNVLAYLHYLHEGFFPSESRVSDQWFHILLLEDYAAFLEESEMAHAARCRGANRQPTPPGLRAVSSAFPCLRVGELEVIGRRGCSW